MTTPKTWFITGTSSGFGRRMTERLLERGDRVAATLRTPAVLDGLKQQFPTQLDVQPLDVRDAAAVKRAVEAAWARFSTIDVVVNNAGYGLFGAIEELSDAQLRDQLDTNLTGSLNVIRASLPHLRRQRRGHVLQLSSYGGQVAGPGTGLYHASKWGIEGACESLALEVAGFGVSVTIVEPGSNATRFREAMQSSTAMPEYADSPAGRIRVLRDSGKVPSVGDVERTVSAIIAVTEQAQPPLRLTLGSDSYRAMHAALTERLRQLEAQRELAFSTDAR